METHLGHSTSTEPERTRRIFFDDPLFEEFALRPLIMDGCPLGEVSATASLIEEGDSDGWWRGVPLGAATTTLYCMLKPISRPATLPARRWAPRSRGPPSRASSMNPHLEIIPARRGERSGAPMRNTG